MLCWPALSVEVATIRRAVAGARQRDCSVSAPQTEVADVPGHEQGREERTDRVVTGDPRLDLAAQVDRGKVPPLIGVPRWISQTPAANAEADRVEVCATHGRPTQVARSGRYLWASHHSPPWPARRVRRVAH